MKRFLVFGLCLALAVAAPYREELDDDEDDREDNDAPLRSAGSSVDLLAQELNYLSTRYGGQGVLKVTYSPPNQKIDDSVVHDLGHLNLNYYSPNAYKSLTANNKLKKAPLPARYSVASQNLLAYNRAPKIDNLNKAQHIDHYHLDSRALNVDKRDKLSRLLNLRNPDDDDEDREDDDQP